MNASNDLLKRTNVEDLIRTPVVDPALPQPAIEDTTREPFRLPYNTTDPFQSQHYTADMAAGLSNPQLKTPVVVAAWIFLAIPAIGYWLFHVGQFFYSGHWRTVDTPGEIAATVAGLVVLTAICGLWPYLLLRRRAAKR